MVSRKEVAIVLLMVLLLAGVFTLVTRLGTAQSGAQTQFVTDAVRNAALTCYAVEGAYPKDIEYLREYYGLAYDQSRYMVTYENFADNLLPTIYVTEVED